MENFKKAIYLNFDTEQSQNEINELEKKIIALDEW